MIRCIAIDDEALAHKITTSYCDKLSFISLDATFKNSLDALNYLRANETDLIFLDINMPVLNGLDFLRTLVNPPLVIIISAYQEHALESYEYNVIDYLLKPYSFERFLKAINKVESQLEKIQPKEVSQKIQNPLADTILIKSGNKTYQINLSDILFLESAGSYVKIHLENEIITTLDRLANFENTLLEKEFIRVHRSFIISKAKVNIIEGNRIQISTHQIPVGQSYRAQVKALFQS